MMTKSLAEHVPRENAFIYANGKDLDQPVHLQWRTATFCALFHYTMNIQKVSFLVDVVQDK